MRTWVWVSRTQAHLWTVLCFWIQWSQRQMKSDTPASRAANDRGGDYYLQQGRKWGHILEVIPWPLLVCCGMSTPEFMHTHTCMHIHYHIYVHTCMSWWNGSVWKPGILSSVSRSHIKGRTNAAKLSSNLHVCFKVWVTQIYYGCTYNNNR